MKPSRRNYDRPSQVHKRMSARPGKRVIPPDLEPVTAQALLNLAMEGFTVTSATGMDLTAAIKAQVETVNYNFDTYLTRRRAAESQSDI